jgi:hypothetical protein
MTARPVNTPEVMWAYLANEHKHKGALNALRDRLRLSEAAFPAELAGKAEVVLSAVADAVAQGQCDEAVLATLKEFHQRRWEMRCFGGQDLREVWAQLPGELSPLGNYVPERRGSITELLSGWMDYLDLPQPQALKARDGHHTLVSSIRAGGRFVHRPIIKQQAGEPVVADGRHRLFAFAEVASGDPSSSVCVYWEKPRAG